MHYKIRLKYNSLKKKYKIYRKILIGILTFLVFFPLLLYVFFQFTFVQNYLTEKVSKMLSNKLNTYVSVNKVSYTVLNDIIIENLYIEDYLEDTLIYVEKLSIRPLKIRKNEIHLKRIIIKNFNSEIYSDSTGYTTIRYLIDNLQTKDKEKEQDTISKPFSLKIDKIIIENSSFSYYKQLPDTVLHGMNYDDLAFEKLNVKLKNFIFSDDSINVKISYINLKEQSGFELEKISGDFSYTPEHIKLSDLYIKMPKTKLNFSKLFFEYQTTEDFGDFINKINLNIAIEHDSKLSLYDLSYILPAITGFDQEFLLSGNINGTVSNLNVTDLDVKYNEDTQLLADINVIGLPDIERAYFDITIDTLTSSLKDINSIKNPKDSTKQLIKFPKQLVHLSKINYRAKITGLSNDFIIESKLITNLGNIQTNLLVQRDSTSDNIYGTFAANKLQIGTIIGNKKFGGISLKDTIEFHLNKDKTFSGETSGFIEQVYFNKYDYQNIAINGKFTNKSYEGHLSVNDSNLITQFNGKIDFTKEIPEFDFDLNIDTAQLYKLHFEDEDPESYIKFALGARFKGKKLDDITGEILLTKSLIYQKNMEQIKLDTFIISSYYTRYFGKKFKEIDVASELVVGKVRGAFEFSSLIEYMKHFVSYYLPSLQEKNLVVQEVHETNQGEIGNSFTFEFTLRNSEKVLRIFMPKLQLSHKTQIAGMYDDDKELISLEMKSDKIKFKEIIINDFYFKSETKDSLITKITIKKLKVNKLLFFDNFNLASKIQNDTVLLKIDWKNETDSINSGSLNIISAFAKDTVNSPIININFLKDTIFINNRAWVTENINIIYQNKILFLDKFHIANPTKGQNIGLSGKLSKDSTHQIDVYINNFDISELNPLIGKVEIGGRLLGNFNIKNILGTPIINSYNTIYKFMVNKVNLNTLVLRSNWDTDSSKMHVHLFTEKNSNDNTTIRQGDYYEEDRDTIKDRMVNIVGDYYMKTKKLDFEINFYNFLLRSFYPFINNYFTKLNRYAAVKGKLDVFGTTDKPLINGNLDLSNIGFIVNYTNVKYNFNDKIQTTITNSTIQIHEATIMSQGGGHAKIKGNIFHTNFKDFFLDIQIAPDSLLFFNMPQTDSSKFYGSVTASGDIDLQGEPTNLIITAQIQTEKNTDLSILLNSRAEIKENNSFITFVEEPTEIQEQMDTTETNESNEDDVKIKGITLNLNLNITPDAHFHLIMDETTGEVLNIQSSGNMAFQMNPFGDMILLGTLTIINGDYLFALQNIISKKFIVKKGSTIKWRNGSPTDATLDITAVHQMKNVSLYDLVLDNEYREIKTPVDCEITITEDLMAPNLAFNIDLPKADQKIISQLKHLEAQDINKQVISLLVMGRFQPLPGLTADKQTLSGAVNAGEVISNQVNHWLSDVSSDVDLGVDYEGGDELSTEQVKAALSFKLWDDRVTVNTDVGVDVGNNPAIANKVVGDVEVDVKMNKKGTIKFKAFNRSNKNEVYNSEKGDYTQGIGFSFKKDFDKIFNKKKK